MAGRKKKWLRVGAAIVGLFVAGNAIFDFADHISHVWARLQATYEKHTAPIELVEVTYVNLDALISLLEDMKKQSDLTFATPDGSFEWPDIHWENFAYRHLFIPQGDSTGKIQEEWILCVGPGKKPDICSKSPEYRLTHPIHNPDWH